MGNCELKIKPADGACSTTNSPFFKEQTFSISQFSINQLKKKKHGQEIYLETGHPDVGDHPHGYWHNAGRHFLPVKQGRGGAAPGRRKGCLLTDAVIASF
jgi:hypothetical protein